MRIEVWMYNRHIDTRWLWSFSAEWDWALRHLPEHAEYRPWTVRIDDTRHAIALTIYED